MDAGLIYANARIKSLENTLLTNDKMFRMIDAVSLEEAVKVLIESNYGGGTILANANEFENLLSAENQAISSFIRELMPEGLGMEIFFIKQDYHNAKALMKAKYLKESNAAYMLTSQGFIDIDKLTNLINSDSYAELYPDLADALENIDLAFSNGERSPRIIDVIIDKAYFVHAHKIASKGTKSIENYFTALADLTNISSLIRCRRAGLSIKNFSLGFVSGGKLNEAFFTSLYEVSDEAVNDKFKYSEYKDIVDKAIENKGKALVIFETAVDDYLLNIFKKDKYDMFSVAPMVGYYLAKMTEIKVARMILVCMKNGVSEVLIKQRLRELYA